MIHIPLQANLIRYSYCIIVFESHILFSLSFICFTGIYFAATVFLLSLCIAMTVVILNLHHKGGFKNKMPRMTQILILNWLAKLVCLKGRIDRNISQNLKDEFEGDKSNVRVCHV